LQYVSREFGFESSCLLWIWYKCFPQNEIGASHQQLIAEAPGEFYMAHEIPEAVRRESGITIVLGEQPNQHAVRVVSSVAGTPPGIRHALHGESWQPGQLHPRLSRTHNRTMLRADKSKDCAFCEVD
jgi:hypothetical protein